MKPSSILTSAAWALAALALFASCGIQKQPSGRPSGATTDAPPRQTAPAPDTIPNEPHTALPGQTEPAPTTESPTVQTEPPILYPPRIPTLSGDEIILTAQNGRYTFEEASPSGTPLYLVARGDGVMNPDGSLTLTVELLLHHYNIYCKERLGCFLRVGNETVHFDTAVISQKTKEESLTAVQTLTVTLDPGQVIEIEALVPFYGTYNGSEVNILTYYQQFAVIPEGMAVDEA